MQEDAVKEVEQGSTVQRPQEDARQVDKGTVKDDRYWEEKVADAMRRISQRLAA